MMRVAIIALAAAACTVGAPPGFSGGRGDRWTFPLLGPIENGVLLTPVMLNTHGPYVFAIDPDAGMSIVDAEVVKEAKLRTFNGPKRVDEGDTQQTRIYAEVIGMELGSLIVERRDVIVVRGNTFDTAGRRVHGVIGRDILAESIVFGFDRDQGLAHVVTQSSFRPPADAAVVGYELLPSQLRNVQVLPEPRRLVKATIGGEAVTLHVDFGAVPSQLRDNQWERTKLVSRDIDGSVVDEMGSRHPIKRASEPVAVTLGAVTGDATFVPYTDKRWEELDLAGTLGLGFFARHAVWASWDQRKLYLAPRTAVPAATRITRWESAVLAKCKNTGCVQTRVVDPLQGKQPDAGKAHPGLVLSITRDEPAGGMDLEIYLEAEGKPELPYLIVNLPPHVDRMIHQLKAEFLDAKLVVVDASPYPRKCPAANGCVDQLAR